MFISTIRIPKLNYNVNITVPKWNSHIPYLKETRNSSKTRPLDFEKKWKLNSEICFVKYQWTHVRLSPLCYFANLFSWKRCLNLRGDWKVGVLENFTKIIGKHVCNFIKKWLLHRCFSVNFAKFSRTTILKNICERLFRKPLIQ